MRAKVIVELGVKQGNSTLPLLMAAAENDGRVFSVDREPTLFNPGELQDYWQFERQDSLLFLAGWPKDKKIDLVFIDDWHSHEHVKKELQLLDPLVGPSSLILVHDTMIGRVPYYYADLTLSGGQWAGGGPYRALAELDQQFWEFSTIPVAYGLTVLRKKRSKHGWNM